VENQLPALFVQQQQFYFWDDAVISYSH
jgi:hypothetical protein